MKGLRILFSTVIALFFVFESIAQDDRKEEKNQTEKSVNNDQTKRFCTPKVIGMSPTKLFSVGYEYLLKHKIDASEIGSIPSQTENVQNYNGLAIKANVPVVMKDKILISLGVSFVQSNYSFSNNLLYNPLLTATNRNLKTLQLNSTIFKPLNEKNFILGFLQGDYSGDYKSKKMQSIGFTKLTWALAYGWKFNERYQFGLGLTQTYRAGGKSFVPVIIYNYTAKNEKWGVEAQLPGRAHFRYNFDKQTLLLAGFEIVGSSYHLSNLDQLFPENNAPNMEKDYDNRKIELRRSEIRPRIEFQRAITKLVWFNLQAGYAVNTNFNVDSGNFYRGFGSKNAFLMENKVSNAPYFQASINFVNL